MKQHTKCLSDIYFKIYFLTYLKNTFNYFIFHYWTLNHGLVHTGKYSCTNLYPGPDILQFKVFLLEKRKSIKSINTFEKLNRRSQRREQQNCLGLLRLPSQNTTEKDASIIPAEVHCSLFWKLEVPTQGQKSSVLSSWFANESLTTMSAMVGREKVWALSCLFKYEYNSCRARPTLMAWKSLNVRCPAEVHALKVWSSG